MRPRSRGERRSLRTFAGVSLRPPPAAFNPDTPRRADFRRRLTPIDAAHPDFSTAVDRPRAHGRTRTRPRTARAHRVALGPHARARVQGETRRVGRRAHQPDPRAGRGVRDTPRAAHGEGHERDAEGAFYTLVPIRPRRRGERHSLRTFAGASLRPPIAFNARPRRLSTPSDAFELHPDIRSYGTTLRWRRMA
jgi:hypothetical protein